jgi:uncharacterized protein (TIGR04255 family)
MEHPQLARSPLVEALFEVRFVSNLPYGLLPGQMLDRLADSFPDAIELDAAHLPSNLPEPFPPVVRHRFRSGDGSRMFQTGIGLASVNHTAYTRFAGLRADVEKVLDSLIDLGGLNSLSRLGLRYINRIDAGRPWPEITSALYSLPGAIEDRLKQRRLLFNLEFGDDRMNVVLADNVVDGSPKLDIDLDFHRPNARSLVPSVLAILSWLDTAHEEVYQAFMSLLAETYLDEIR